MCKLYNHDVREWIWLSLNEMWREPDDHVACRNVSVASNRLNYGHPQD